MTARVRLIGCLLFCWLVALVSPAASLAAEKPSPQELWELYPLDPSGRGAGERPATTSPAAAEPSPAGDVAGTSTTRRDATPPEGSRVAPRGSHDGGTSLLFGILIGGVVAAIFMLGSAMLPESRSPRIGRSLRNHRAEMAVAGTLTLLVVTAVYLIGGAS